MLPPGEIIPGTRYRIVTRVGAGAMGAVYLAEHVDLEKRVALKTLHAASARDPKAIERFRQEARAASKIGNPNICDVTDFGQLPDGQAFFVMEYINGPSLRSELEQDEPLGIERSISILRQVCKALGAAHGKGIVHLDVKPDNIMLAASGRRRDLVKVVDFGIAGLVSAGPAPDGTAAEDKVVGTPDYLAPERIRGKGYDHRSDIYSLGAMAYEMLTGVCPFWDKDVMVTVAHHVTEKPQSLRQRAPDAKIPAELETLVLQMLEKNPAGRPQSTAVVEAMLCDAQIAARLQTEWDDLELPEVDEDWRRKLADKMPSPRSRRLRRLALSLGLVAVLGLGAALFFGLRRPKEIIAYTPVFVEITKTDEAETVAPFLRKAAAAAEAEKYFQPVEESALRNIEAAEQEAHRLATTSGGAASLRRIYGNQFRSLGNALLEAGLSDLAGLRFAEALRFLPADSDLRERATRTAEARHAGAKPEAAGAAAKATNDDLARSAAANLFAAMASGHFTAARTHLARLLEVDKQGTQIARLSDDFRKRAQAQWESGKRADARPYYQVVSELDPKDLMAQERAKSPLSAEEGPSPEDTPESAKPAHSRAGAELPEESSPRGDRVRAARAASEGREALAQGNLNRAQDAFNRAVRADSANPEAVAGLAEVAFENARYVEALDYARRAVALRPKAARYHVILGDAYFKLLRYDKALASYQRARGLSPKDEGVNARIARVQAKLGT
jgi:tetratricopeptide (TPR) repeat protein/tRNA A-37 threonylcarbamoyl transferase component Bud32